MVYVPSILFTEPADVVADPLILMVGPEGAMGTFAHDVNESCGGMLVSAVEGGRRKCDRASLLEMWVPGGSDVRQILLVGLGKSDSLCLNEWRKLGESLAKGLREKRVSHASIVLERPEGWLSAEEAATFAAGLGLGTYRFDKYKTEQGEMIEPVSEIRAMLRDWDQAEELYRPMSKIVEAVALTRDLVNEPANILGTEEFSARIAEMSALGMQVEILGESEMRAAGMNALLGVSQGSVRPPRLAVMRWQGSDSGAPWVAFVGKGVVFDSGGLSLKPAAHMEEMKGDMAGAAVIVGAMYGLASRKAKANVIGVVGLVENMPDGAAQRPGDIVQSMSGQTIEVLNTDAEGRLVLADVLWYTQDRFRPVCMIDLATLTGAVVIALGRSYAGMLSNDDNLSGQLIDSATATGERLWRLPLDSDYDKAIDSRVADMKNTGDRGAGAIVAGQFLQRFVNKVAWAHIDIAGVSMSGRGGADGEIEATGFGVRLLDGFISRHFET